MPPQIGVGPQVLDAPLSDLGREHRAEPIPPEADGLVTDINAAFVQEIFHIAKGEREPDVEHYDQANDFRRRFEIAERPAIFIRNA